MANPSGRGVSLHMIGKLLGHKDPATTQRYAHLARDAVQAVNDELGAAMQAACMSFGDNDLRLILEYHAMPRPNKEKLARYLVKKNEILPEHDRYPVNSKEDPAAAILQQIKRAFRFDQEACRIIGGAPEYLRQERLKEIGEARLRLLKITRKIKLPRICYITIRQRFSRPEDAWIFNGGQKRA